MSQHRIQLRRAWTAWFVATESRLDLPIFWDQSPPPVRLRRRFQRPQIDDSWQILAIEMIGISGVTAARLNGHDLLVPSASNPICDVLTGAWKPVGNELILEVDPAQIDASAEWGQICLLIRSR